MIPISGIHHLTLTVTDLARAYQFYNEVLGFEMLIDLQTGRYILGRDGLLLAISLPPDPNQAPDNDVYNENRVGLDHLSFAVPSHADMEAAVKLFDERGIPHGEIKDLGGMGIYVLAFRDPDNIQLELTAPKD